MQTAVDFTPQSYRARERRRRMLMRRVALAVVMLALMGVWTLAHRGQVRQLEQRLANVELQLDQAEARKRYLAELRQQRAQAVHRVSLNRQLSPEVLQTQVLAVLSTLMPREMAASHLTSRRVEASGNEPARLSLELTGHSPDDMALAELLERLQEHAMFEGVRMRYSRARVTEAGRTRDFRVEMQVKLDRRYTPLAMGEGVADAH